MGIKGDTCCEGLWLTDGSATFAKSSEIDND